MQCKKKERKRKHLPQSFIKWVHLHPSQTFTSSIISAWPYVARSLRGIPFPFAIFIYPGIWQNLGQTNEPARPAFDLIVPIVSDITGGIGPFVLSSSFSLLCQAIHISNAIINTQKNKRESSIVVREWGITKLHIRLLFFSSFFLFLLFFFYLLSFGWMQLSVCNYVLILFVGAVKDKWVLWEIPLSFRCRHFFYRIVDVLNVFYLKFLKID